MFRSVNIFSILMLAAVVAPLVRATNNTTNSTERKYPKQVNSNLMNFRFFFFFNNPPTLYM